ncbi:MAG: FtsW/RodA/SpoVE family cell cycle protein [Caulobacteraceae bacterium]
MFEVLSWTYRFVYIFITSAFCISCYLVYLKGKSFLSYLIPFLNILLVGSGFALLSYYEPIDYRAIYVGSGLLAVYIFSRFITGKLLATKDLLLFDVVFHLLSIGLLILYRLSPDYGVKQAYFALAGIFVFFAVIIAMKLLEIKEKHYILLWGLILALLIVTQLFGTEINGSKNWINLHYTLVQPSEFIKILFVFFISCILSKDLDLKRFMWTSAAVLTVVAFFALQRDMGSAFLFFTAYLTVLLANDIKCYYTLLSACAAALGGLVSYFTFSYIKYRVLAWVNPWKYIAGKSYQITQSLFAVASGGLIGTGIFLGDPKYIPAVHTDFIFSAISEETGILSAMALVAIYTLLTLISMDISFKAGNKIYSNAALGLTSLTAIQTLIIVCGVLNIIPITGVTLPLISYGGSSLLSQFINVGLLYYIKEKRQEQHENAQPSAELR